MTKQKVLNSKQANFFIDEGLQITGYENIEKWTKENVVSNNTLTIHDLLDTVKYPLLNLFSSMQLNKSCLVEDYFQTNSATDEGGIRLKITAPKKHSSAYKVEVEEISNSSSPPTIKNEERNIFGEKINATIESVNRLEKIEKNYITNELRSIRNQLTFRQHQLLKSRKDLQLLLENNPQSSILIDHLYSVIEYNSQAEDLIQSIFNKRLEKNIVLLDLFTPDDKKKLKKKIQTVLNGEKEHSMIDLTIISPENEKCTFRFDVHAVKRFHQSLNAATLIITEKTDQLLSSKVRSINLQLMKVAMDPKKTGEEIATFFIEEFEKVFESTKCSILATRGDRFENIASPSLPSELVNITDGVKMDANTGTCGAAASRQEITISEDLYNDQKWAQFKSTLQNLGLRSCVSYPIINSQNETVATFAVYRNEKYVPTKREVDICKQFAELLAIIAEMQAHKAKHENLLNSIQDGFFSLNKNLEINYWNKTAESITGIKADDAINNNLWQTFPNIEEETRKAFVELINNANKHNSLTAYFPLLKKWFELIVYTKDEQFVSVFFRDVSERIHKERELVEAKDRLEKVMNAANDAIYELNLNSREINWSKGYQDLFGYDLEKDDQDGWDRFELVHPDQREKMVRNFENTLADPKKQKWSAEYSFKRSNDSYAHVMDRGYIIRDSEGNAVKLIGAITDISYHKEYEESLIYLNKVLRERAIQLQQNNEELEQFAYLASHDLQEPLRTITNFIFQLERKYGDELDERGKKYIHFVVEGAERMRKLITDILNYSKIGKGEEQLSLVDMNQLITSIQSSMKQQIIENEASFKVTNLPKIDGNEAHLYQIFSNLISNAIKYRKKEVAPEINISYQKNKGYHLFKVKDNGIGITPEFHGKIFEIFQRLHNDSEYSGTGIGLAMVKKSVDQLGGEVLVDNHESGTTFIVRIPEIQDIQEDKTKIMQRL